MRINMSSDFLLKKIRMQKLSVENLLKELEADPTNDMAEVIAFNRGKLQSLEWIEKEVMYY